MSRLKATENPEFDKFDAIVGKLLSVPRKELQKREKKYQQKRARLKNKK
jgi:hypothetical protein